MGFDGMLIASLIRYARGCSQSAGREGMSFGSMTLTGCRGRPRRPSPIRSYRYLPRGEQARRTVTATVTKGYRYLPLREQARRTVTATVTATVTKGSPSLPRHASLRTWRGSSVAIGAWRGRCSPLSEYL